MLFYPVDVKLKPFNFATLQHFNTTTLQQQIKHLDIIVKGRVQGVSFRFATKAVADQLGVKGFVKNEPNGDVFIAAEAVPTTMDMFLDFCHEGSDHATVEAVETREGEIKNYRNFEIVKRSL